MFHPKENTTTIITGDIPCYPMISHDKSIQLLTVTLVAVRRKVTLVAGTTCKFQALSAVTGKGIRGYPMIYL